MMLPFESITTSDGIPRIPNSVTIVAVSIQDSMELHTFHDKSLSSNRDTFLVDDHVKLRFLFGQKSGEYRSKGTTGRTP